MDVKDQNNVRNHFLNKKDQKILIYGTKAHAKSLVTSLKGFCIMGVLDRQKVEGDFLGIPILEWDEIQAGTADILIVGADEKYYDEIYTRIIYRCTYLNICIYGYNGQNLNEKYAMRNFQPGAAAYLRKSEEELRKLIDAHDAISFDLFDTLIMRKVLEPSDIFKLVEERLKIKGYAPDGFYKKRRTAENLSDGGDIYIIYQKLGQLLSISDRVLSRIMREEIECEKELLISREKMVELFEYAVSMGKQVNIISDMYYPSDILEDILAGLGICGFHKIFVSCEYGKSKENGLFQEYKSEIKGTRYLHIGDDRKADITAAVECGIDAYQVKSGFEMLKMTSMRRCLIYTLSGMDRRMMGELVSLIFNNPFSLHDTAGILHIKDRKAFAYIFFIPLIITYMQKLEEITSENDYEGILFTSRDGYLLKKIYDGDCMKMKGVRLQSHYLLISRLLSHKVEAGQTRKNYFEYLKKSDIDISKKYLVCDLISQGTVLKGINRLFESRQHGLFMAWSYCSPELPVKVVYDDEEWQEMRFTTCILEKVITSLEPSIDDMGKEGIPIFAQEDRSKDEIRMIDRIHAEIIAGIESLYKLPGGSGELSKKLAQTLFYMIDDVVLCDEMNIFNDFRIVDDFSKEEIHFKR